MAKEKRSAPINKIASPPRRFPQSKRETPSSQPPMSKRDPALQTTTLWDFPSQNYGRKSQGSSDYLGATPSYVIWNLLMRYTNEGDKVLDPMCGSGTTLDVCRDLKREGIGFDLAPFREDIRQSDARHLPLKSQSIDFIFIDPPYSTHLEYSNDPRCLGRLSAHRQGGGEYFEALQEVLRELHRVLKKEHFMGIYVCDSFLKKKGFSPIGFEIFAMLQKLFVPVDIVCVTRHNRTLKRNHWHTAAVEHNYFLRGFNYLFIAKKP